MNGSLQENKNAPLTQGHIGRTLLLFALPLIAASVLQALYGAADVFVVGQFSTSADVSAVSVSSNIMHTITTFVIALCNGGTLMIGQYVGAQDHEKAARSIGALIIVALLISVFITGLVFLFPDVIISLVNMPAEAVSAGKDYLLICAAGIPLVVGYNAVSSLLRGFGDSKTPLLFVAIACVVNIVADIVLVKGFAMGAMGAAIATSGSQGLAFLFALLYLKKRGLPFSFKVKEHVRFDGFLIKRLLRFGMPLAVNYTLISLSFLIITAIVNEMGLIASAAVGVADKITMFILLVPSAMANAVSAMVAQNIGAERLDRAKQTMFTGIGLSLIFAVISFTLSQWQPEALIRAFTKDADVIATAVPYLRGFSYDCFIVSFVFNMNAFFNGCGKPLFTMMHNLLTSFLVRIPISYIVSRTAGASLLGVGLAVPAASLVSLSLCVLYYWRNKHTLGRNM